MRKITIPAIGIHFYSHLNLLFYFRDHSCNIKESVQVYKLITEYIRLATVENPQIGNLFASEYRRSCASIASIDELFSLASGESELLQSSDHLKCIIETVSEVVAETEVAKLWIKYHKELERSYERIKACKTLSGQWEITKYVFLFE